MIQRRFPKRVRPSAKGVTSIPVDVPGLAFVAILATDACEACPEFRNTAIVCFGLGIPPRLADGSQPTPGQLEAYGEFKERLDEHPESARLQKAVWTAIVASQVNYHNWSSPVLRPDSEFLRASRVAAARMLSQHRLWTVVPRPGNRVGLLRVDWPVSFTI